MSVSDYLPNNRYQLIGFFGSLIIRILADYWMGRTSRIRLPAEIDLLAISILRLWNWIHNPKQENQNGDNPKS
jgi:hypothetical protein